MFKKNKLRQLKPPFKWHNANLIDAEGRNLLSIADNSFTAYHGLFSDDDFYGTFKYFVKKAMNNQWKKEYVK